MAWEAWRLVARSRAEEAIRGRISSVKKELRKAHNRAMRSMRNLEEELEGASFLVRKVGEAIKARHRLVGELKALSASLEEATEVVSRLLQETAMRIQALANKHVRLDMLVDGALREAAVGSLDRAHELVVEVEREKEALLHELSSLSDVLEERRRMLAGLRRRIEDVLEHVGREVELVDKAGVRLREGELVCLARRCRARGAGRGVLLITSERIVFSRPGDKGLELERAWVRGASTSRAFLGLREKLVIAFSGPGGRGELVLYCNRKDAKDILAELSAGAKGGHEAQVGGLHPGRGGAHSDGRPDDGIT